MNAQETTTLQGIVARFEATHPDIEVDMVTVPFDQAQLKFATAAQAGKAPDVLRAEIAPDRRLRRARLPGADSSARSPPPTRPTS